MASTCPVDLDTLRLRAEIESIYRRVATEPSGDFHFHRGPTYAAEMLGYDAVELARLPADSTAAFAGVANPHRIATMTAGATVVDIGCGAGMDLLLAAQAVGSDGRAIGVDMTEAMAERARNGARSRGLAHVEVRLGDAMSLPVESESVDVVISNGVLNLFPDKFGCLREMARVLRPEGRLQIGDIIVQKAVGEKGKRDINLWKG